MYEKKKETNNNCTDNVTKIKKCEYDGLFS